MAGEFVWWDHSGWATREGVQALCRLEDQVFEQFPLEPPPKSMLMHKIDFWDGGALTLKSAGELSDDDQRIAEVFGRLPWIRLCGERLLRLGDNFLLGPSIDAHAYYTPAYMLHAIHMRAVEHQEVLELFLPPDDLVVLDAFSGVRTSPDGASERYFGNYMHRAREFRARFDAAKSQVIAEFLRYYVAWDLMRPGKNVSAEFEASVRAARTRLIDYWQRSPD